MNPAETEALARPVQRLSGFGATVLLVEHDMGFVMGISHVITVLNFGRRIFEGPPSAVRQEPAVIEAYLGHKVAAAPRQGGRERDEQPRSDAAWLWPTGGRRR